MWNQGEPDLFADSDFPTGPQNTLSVPRAFVELARSVICHSDKERFALLYTLLWRLQVQRTLIDDHADPLVRRCDELAKAVRRDNPQDARLRPVS